MSPANKVLILYAHPAPHKSVVNVRLAAAVRDLPGVTFRDLYETYPDFMIDVPREQELLLGHDVLVMQHPFYWYSTPAILKEWCDLVLEYGFAFGDSGSKLRGKRWLHAISAGGPRPTYEGETPHHYSLRHLLAPLEQSARFCEMTFLDPFVVYDARSAKSRDDAGAHAARYRDLIASLTRGVKR